MRFRLKIADGGVVKHLELLLRALQKIMDAAGELIGHFVKGRFDRRVVRDFRFIRDFAAVADFRHARRHRP